jgi:hypothetical protein
LPASNNRGIFKKQDVTRTAVAMEQLSKHVSAGTNTSNNRRSVFSVRTVPTGYKKDKEVRFKTIEFRETSLPEYELEGRGI